MASSYHTVHLPQHKTSERIALACLLFLGGWAVLGPTGIFAWSEAVNKSEQRSRQIAALETEINELSNRVTLLDPENADPDMVGELLRSNLNVVHPDEVVLTIGAADDDEAEVLGAIPGPPQAAPQLNGEGGASGE